MRREIRRQVDAAERALQETQNELKRRRYAERVAGDIALNWLSSSCIDPFEREYVFSNVGGRVKNVTVRLDSSDWVATAKPE
jgi:hypothetical protein